MALERFGDRISESAQFDSQRESLSDATCYMAATVIADVASDGYAGATHQTLHEPVCREAIEFPLPPLAEQRRIAEILDQADALRAKRRAALAQLDTLTQSIFLDMFGDPADESEGVADDASLGELFERCRSTATVIRPDDRLTAERAILRSGRYIVDRRMSSTSRSTCHVESTHRRTREVERFARPGDLLFIARTAIRTSWRRAT